MPAMPVLLAAIIVAASPDAGSSVVVKLEGGGKVGALTVKDLHELGAVTADWSDKSASHKVTGVRLDRLLARLGFDEGATGPKAEPKEKHQGLRAAIIATAADGYQAVFSVAEVQEELGTTTVLVVWEMDGKPLPPAVGPLRLVVTTDKRQTRSLFQLVGLRLMDLRGR
jgi:DMSO/TMAO reductase YedYZ molybdopterin-dependent catalytic subunit